MVGEPDDAALLVRSTDQPDAPPYRPFRDVPNGVWVDRVAQHIKETGQPETFLGLFQGAIDRDAKFRIIRQVRIDRKKRPEGDMAPCPVCKCPDKFLAGALVWYFELQCCAVIGHCCAGHEVRVAAEKDFKKRKQFEFEQTYLLEGLPLLAPKAELLKSWRTPAGEALRLFRQFRNEGAVIHRHLRERIKVNRRGELVVVEVLHGGEEENASDYVGPDGFNRAGRSRIQAREHDFGLLLGLIAIGKQYDPIKELDDIGRRVASFGDYPDEERALELIVVMSDEERRAAVAIVRGVDRAYATFVERLNEFWSFFSPLNVERLTAYGTHPANDFSMSARFATSNGRAAMILGHGRLEVRLIYKSELPKWHVAWHTVRVTATPHWP